MIYLWKLQPTVDCIAFDIILIKCIARHHNFWSTNYFQVGTVILDMHIEMVRLIEWENLLLHIASMRNNNNCSEMCYENNWFEKPLNACAINKPNQYFESRLARFDYYSLWYLSAYSLIENSTRLFCSLPSSVPLLATGLDSPQPLISNRTFGILACMKYWSTTSALRCDNRKL